MKIDWKRKLTSRKLWVAVAGMVMGLILAFGGSEAAAETVSGCILSAASVIAYIIGEGLADAGHAAQSNGSVEQQPEVNTNVVGFEVGHEYTNDCDDECKR